VVVTVDALGEFARAVGAGAVTVTNIVPAGMEPHDFEPKATDMMKIADADVFIYNGLGMDSWVGEVLEAVGNPRLVAVEASAGAELIGLAGDTGLYDAGGEISHIGGSAGTATANGTDGADGADDAGIAFDGGAHPEDGYDPHVWLGISGAKAQAANIAAALCEADPARRGSYEANLQAFRGELDALKSRYEDVFAQAPRRIFVTGHAAFGYLCKEFGLEQVSVEGVFAEGEPNARQLAALTEYCRENRVTVVFAEEMAAPQVSEALAREVGARVETIYTMESAQDGKTYLERMGENLEKIAGSLYE
jgi:zinc transport system substrate-binding protein